MDSPFRLTTQLITHLSGILSPIDVYQLPMPERKIITDLRQQAADARLDTRDYELSETRDEQAKNANIAKKRLNNVRKDILTASEYNIFNAVDVAQLSSTIDHIIACLE